MSGDNTNHPMVSMEEDALNFFDQVFSLVPESFRQAPRDFLTEPFLKAAHPQKVKQEKQQQKQDKQSNNDKEKQKQQQQQNNQKNHQLQQKQSQPMSLIELKEKAAKRIQDIQSVNREKSLNKIKELTLQHKQNPPTQGKKGQQDSDDAEMDSEGGDSDGEEKKEGDKTKQFKNKGAVSADKQQNKRQYKEARKKLKLKKKQGIMDKGTQQNTAVAKAQAK